MSLWQSRLLSRRIKAALEQNAEGFATRDEKEAHWFLTTEKLNEILNRETLAILFEDLLKDLGDDLRLTSPHLWLDNDSHTSRLTESCIEATVENPSRKVLLAMFLYLHEEYLLRKLLQWATSSNLGTPSYHSMPFTREALRSCDIRELYHWHIFRTKPMFRPVAILKG